MITLYTLATWSEQHRVFRDREAHELHAHLSRDVHVTLHHAEGDIDGPCLLGRVRHGCPGPTGKDREIAKDFLIRGWRLTDVFADTETVHGPIDSYEGTSLSLVPAPAALRGGDTA